MKVLAVKCLNNNYSYIIYNRDRNAVIIDAPEAEPIITRLQKLNLKPKILLNTHHHADHTAGNTVLKKNYNLKIMSSYIEKNINLADIYLKNEQIIELENIKIKTLLTPGHTNGHLCFFIESIAVIFCGDLLFSLGCGRNFEGSLDEIFTSIQKIKSIKKATIYPGHDYFSANKKFLIYLIDNLIAPFNNKKNISKALCYLNKHKSNNVSFELAEEISINPFMLANLEQFKVLRKLKNNF